MIVKGAQAEDGDVTINMAATDVNEQNIDDINDLDEHYLPSDNKQTIYGVNNAVTNLPWKLDLNETNKVKKLVKTTHDLVTRYLEGMCIPSKYTTNNVTIGDGDENSYSDTVERSLAGSPWAENDWPEENWPHPWMYEHGFYFCGNGHPTFAANKFRRNDRKFRRIKFTPLSGGFHTMLDMHKLRGKMFGTSHLREIWGHWWQTEAQLNWVTNPGDPN